MKLVNLEKHCFFLASVCIQQVIENKDFVSSFLLHGKICQGSGSEIEQDKLPSDNKILVESYS